MITAGIDIGSLYTKAAIIQDGKLISHHVMKTGESSKTAAEISLDNVLAKASISKDMLNGITATGVGKEEADVANGENVTEVTAAARGALFMNPGIRGVIDAGGESTRVLKLDDSGKLIDFALNDKCAAGTGIFLDEMGRLMGVTPDEMGPLSLESAADVDITSMCVVFAESEVVSLVHRQTPKVDIIKGIHKSIAVRIYGMINKIGIGDGSAVTGGLALNTGIVSILEKMMNTKLIIPEFPQLAGAIGAAVIASEKAACR